MKPPESVTGQLLFFPGQLEHPPPFASPWRGLRSAFSLRGGALDGQDPETLMESWENLDRQNPGDPLAIGKPPVRKKVNDLHSYAFTCRFYIAFHIF